MSTPDLFSSLLQQLGPQAAAYNQSQGADPSAGPTIANLQALQGAQGGPAGAMQSPMDPVMNNAQAVMKQALQSPEDKIKDLWRQYYGLQPGQEGPTKGQKVKSKLREFVQGLFDPTDYGNPEKRLREQALKSYQEQTQRLGTASPMENMLGRLYTAQEQIAQRDRALAAMNDRFGQQLAEKTREADQRNDYRQAKNAIDMMNAMSNGDYRKSAAAYNQVKTQLAQIQLKYPNLTPIQLAELLSEGDAQKKAQILDTLNEIKKAETPYVGSTSVSTPTEGGQTFTTTTKTLNNMPWRNTPTPSVLPGVGAPQAGPRRQVAPQVPQAGGQAGAVSPSSPSSAGLPAEAASLDPLNQVNPTAPMSRVMQGKRAENNQDLMVGNRNIDRFRLNAGQLASSLLDSIKSGKDQDYRGMILSHPMMQELRAAFGDVSPEEAIQKGLTTDILFNKLGINVKGAGGRLNIPEIAGHARNTGSMTQSAGNALMAVASLKLMADAQKMFANGQLRPEDAQLLNRAVTQELGRLQDMVGKMRPTPNGKNTPVPQYPKDSDMQVRDLAEIMRGLKQRAAPISSAIPFSVEDIDREIAKRKGAKK